MRPRSLFLCLSLPVVLALGHVAVGCVFRSADDCELTLGFGCNTTGSSSSSGGAGGGGGTTSATTSSSGGGTGGGPTCVDPSLCPDAPKGPCEKFATKVCDQGKCAIKYTVADAPSQQYGSCKKQQCDATGKVVDVPDETNVYDDGNPCTQESCTADGMPVTMSLANGTACTIGGGSGYCEPHPDPYNAGLVVCSECDPNGGQPTCLGGAVCSAGKCVLSHCKNGMKDLGETDIDCGGIGTNSGCLKCLPGKSCTSGLDCWSSICTNGKCATPTCSDNVQNQDETGQDCGGSCSPCADGYNCLRHGDCISGVCKASAAGMPNTCQPPSCTDGVMNGDETAVDCGGPMCPPCAQ
jgi:hypothetical protein